MTEEDILQRLQELFHAKEVTDGFPSKEDCLSWSHKVAPLLRFNPQYHQTFAYYLQIITRNISVYTAEPAFRTMKSQVEMAIEELKVDIAVASTAATPKRIEETKTLSVLKLEPNIYGIGINLNELWRRTMQWFHGK